MWRKERKGGCGRKEGKGRIEMRSNYKVSLSMHHFQVLREEIMLFPLILTAGIVLHSITQPGMEAQRRTVSILSGREE